MRRRSAGAVGVVLAVGLALTACGGDDGGPGATVDAPRQAEARLAVGELCRGAGEAAAGETATAAGRFEDVHRTLHEIAYGLTAEGGDARVRAAELLRAKQQLEATVANPAASPALGAELRSLATAVANATGVPSPCP